MPALLAIAALLLAMPAMAQNPTGTLKGTITDAQGAGLPGVTITASSPSLQGERSTQSGGNGDYKLGFLPPGTYEISFELEGFSSVLQAVKISAAQTAQSDIQMQLSEVVETINVTANLETISETTTGSSTYDKDEIEKLAVARNIVQSVALAPGVHQTGPDDNVSISGAMSFENLWLVNGVVINENLRGQPLALFIEDAISETTTSTSGISAEYGRFTGGVVNVITKSGGNDFSGSLRVNFANDDWVSKTPLTTSRTDQVNETFEATLGGPIWKDRFWFFLAGRDRELNTTEQTVVTNIDFPQDDIQDRLEAKATISLTPSHSVIGSYLEINQETTNSTFGDNLDLDSLTSRTDPQEIKSVNYTGILSPSFFVEAQYSERDYGIANGAGGPRDLIRGSSFETTFDNSAWHAPAFCGECEDEIRNNENFLVKGSYFLSTADSGSHDITFGYDTFTDIRFAVNHQTGSDFRLAADDFFIGPDNAVYPVLLGNSQGSAWVAAWPVFGLDNARPTDFVTNSFYVNDSWQLNEKWSFNIGVRYDENDATDSGGGTTADDSKVSPRLGFSYDVKGDGDLVVNASYGTYVAALANNRANAVASGGAIGRAILFYDGPPVNPDGDACLATNSCVSSRQAVETMIGWWLDTTNFNPITDRPELIANIPGVLFLRVPGTETNQFVDGTLKSPSADEFTFGITKRLGTKGLMRADVVFREWEDFYSNSTAPNDQVLVEGSPQDRILVGNRGDNVLEREYLGVHLQARYRLTDRFTLAGTYTWSELEGNINGETALSGPVTSSPNDYAEYKETRWNSPVGPLLADQTHKLRFWGVYDVIDNERNNLSVSLLQSFFSGQPYSASGAIDSRPYVTNPGYISPPGTVTYFYGPRGGFTEDDVTRTDIALNYSFSWNAFGQELEVFIQPEMLNVFNEDAVTDPDGSIDDPTNSGLATFNPFTDTPVEGVNWARKDTFGTALSQDDFQTARTYRLSVGFRF
jgi:hypothetical protein